MAGNIEFSRLEASFAKEQVVPRQNSVEMKDVQRHALPVDAEANDLDFEFDLDNSKYPLDGLKSVQDVFSAVQYQTHLSKENNFSTKTKIECFDASGKNAEWLTLDSQGMQDIIQMRWECGEAGKFTSCDFFCQYPRWNLQMQGAPLSLYMRHSVADNLTAYVISHKDGDFSIHALRQILSISANTASISDITISDPFDIAVILSTLSFEGSKYHVKRFQRFMWTQINKVDDHLAGLEKNDRTRLGELTKKLQIISQNADSHLANADVSLITANAIQQAHTRLHAAISSPLFLYHRANDSIEYVIKSMEKQKIWFLNYKNRKDSVMNLVYNLVTQQDAANNIILASSMKEDSTSMNAIAALTMVFLPGTFTATILGAGIFSVGANDKKIHVSTIWWIWVVISIPLTIIVAICWRWYKAVKEKTSVVAIPKKDIESAFVEQS
ncbi:hypothetical protein K432DRAFT_308343 [Lepidopterella palustris CBS 459.81]|uniref:Mg2+ transporter protein n=1 Tax=Lepidopterella palustris CBS 459.81 TaxID=1314670 RepID=A0A8E2E174_9PEZI|nr:hypothetical protein K432DRAFT_308343 [Lepidopterella palustris CBS 459.81]